MKPFIIFEGADGAGKSYITQAIYKRWPEYYTIFHNSFIPSTKSQVQALIRQCEEQVNQSPNRRVLADRHTTISELIYGKVIRSNPCLTYDFAERYLRSHRVTVFYIRPPDTVLFTRKLEMQERDESKTHKPSVHISQVMANYQAIIEEYDMLMEKLMHSVPVTWIDTSRKSEFDSFLHTFNPKWKMR